MGLASAIDISLRCADDILKSLGNQWTSRLYARHVFGECERSEGHRWSMEIYDTEQRQHCKAT